MSIFKPHLDNLSNWTLLNVQAHTQPQPKVELAGNHWQWNTGQRKQKNNHKGMDYFIEYSHEQAPSLE
jgi:hypothetical protein